MAEVRTCPAGAGVRRSLHPLALVLALGVASAGAADPSRGQPLVHQVSADGPLASDVSAAGGPPTVSANGEWIVYAQDADADEAFELWSVRRSGGTPVRLTALLPPGTGVVDFGITQDSRRVIYVAAQESASREVFTVPIGGPAAASLKVSPALAPGEDGVFLGLSRDGAHILTAIFVSGSAFRSLWTAPVDGSAAPVLLTETLPADRAIVQTQVSRRSDRLFYISDRVTHQQYELYSVDVDGSAAPVKLNPAMIPLGDVDTSNFSFTESPDGTRLLFSADAAIDGKFELWTVPVGGPSTAAARLLGNVPDWTEFTIGGRPTFTPDSQRVVLTADPVTLGHFYLYSVPADASAPPLQIDSALTAAGDVTGFEITPDGARVLFQADAFADAQFEMFVAPTLGPPTATYRVSGNVLANLDPIGTFVPSPSGDRVLFLAGRAGGGGMDLWSGPFDGSTEPVKISGSSVALGSVTFLCGYDQASGALAYIADALVDEKFELFRTPVDGSSAPSDVSGFAGQPAGADVVECSTAGGGLGEQVVFRADREIDERFELYREDLATNSMVKLNRPLVTGGDVAAQGYAFTPDGYGIWYLADQDIDEKLELYIADQEIFVADFEEADASEWSSALP